MISQLLSSEPAALRASPDPLTPDSDLKTLMTLCDLLNRELLVMISWAKHIPGNGIVINPVHLNLIVLELILKQKLRTLLYRVLNTLTGGSDGTAAVWVDGSSAAVCGVALTAVI